MAHFSSTCQTSQLNSGLMTVDDEPHRLTAQSELYVCLYLAAVPLHTYKAGTCVRTIQGLQEERHGVCYRAGCVRLEPGGGKLGY